jgi:hypothetical protein
MTIYGIIFVVLQTAETAAAGRVFLVRSVYKGPGSLFLDGCAPFFPTDQTPLKKAI